MERLELSVRLLSGRWFIVIAYINEHDLELDCMTFSRSFAEAEKEAAVNEMNRLYLTCTPLRFSPEAKAMLEERRAGEKS